MTPWRDPLPDPATGTFWAALTEPDRRHLAAVGAVRRLPRGTVLSREGHRSDLVWVVLAGRIEVFRDDPAGHRTALSVCRPGDVIGEMSALDGRPASATTAALEAAAALTVPVGRFAAACRERPGVSWPVLLGVVRRLRAADDKRVRQRSDVRDRVVLALLDLAGSAPGPVVLRLTQQHLADLVSAALISVTRSLDELREAGLVVTGRGRIEIPDPARLRSPHF